MVLQQAFAFIFFWQADKAPSEAEPEHTGCGARPCSSWITRAAAQPHPLLPYSFTLAPPLPLIKNFFFGKLNTVAAEHAHPLECAEQVVATSLMEKDRVELSYL